MKKPVFLALAIALLVPAAIFVTNMCVKPNDAKVEKLDIGNVEKVNYEEETETPENIGVNASDDMEDNIEILSSVDMGVTVSGKVGNYTYVDLGLKSGTKWAAYNVGATKPAEYGDYFAWAETKPKVDYGWKTYKYCTVDDKGWLDECLKYRTSTNSKFDSPDNILVLEADDDAATANWGGAWRMPTKEEQKELLDGCEWKWTDDFNGSGIAGRIGISHANGNKIFLPAAGIRLGTELYSDGVYGGFWSSSLCEEFDVSHSAYFLGFGEISVYDGYYDLNSDFGADRIERSLGLSVRAVVK